MGPRTWANIQEDENVTAPKLPWFMHCHGGENTLVGVLPTPRGTYVRSWKDGRYEVCWYPLGIEFPGGGSRMPVSLGKFADGEREAGAQADIAVVDHMHAHPELCLATTWDPRVEPMDWKPAEAGVSTLTRDEGVWLRVSSGGSVALSLLPADGAAAKEMARLSDACSADSLEKRLAGRVLRHHSASRTA